MRIIFILFSCLLSNFTFAQKNSDPENKNLSTYIMGQYNHFVFERAINNDPSGVGIGIETFFLRTENYNYRLNYSTINL